MPRTTKGAGGGKRYPLSMRTTKEARERIEAAAIANGRSLAQEVEARLADSFDEEDQFGGSEMVAIVNLIAGAFLRGGQLGARASQHPEWTPAEWMADPFCYRAAVHSVIDALATAQPKLRWKEGISPEKQLEAERLHDFFAQFEQRHPGSIKRIIGEQEK